jgi:hypothetical protein
MVEVEGTRVEAEGRRRWPLLVLGGVGLFIAVAWLHYLFVVQPLDYANKDFMSLWTGARALLRGLNPYNPAVWTPLRAEYGSEWMPDGTAPFPLWTFLMMIPFGLLPLPQAAAAWLTCQEGLLLLNIALLARYRRQRQASFNELVFYWATAFLSVATVLVLINGQMTYLLLTIPVAYLLLQQRGHQFGAGLALAALALKPNPFILFVPLVGLWLLWQRRWRTVAGAATGGIVLLFIGELVLPGWLPQWLAVRSKTEVVTITPTVWGLAAELSANWWLPVGLLLAIGVTAFIAWFIFSHSELGDATVLALAMAASLLITPYTWAYEQALLFLPWLCLVTRSQTRRQAMALWAGVAWLLPWIIFAVAVVRLKDTLGFVVPLGALLAVAWLVREDGQRTADGRRRTIQNSSDS